MSALPYELFVNGSDATLSGNGGSITSGATSFNLASYGGLPAGPNFRLVIGSEIIKITGYSAGAVSACTRGAEGTSAASHTDGDTVRHVLTQGSLLQMLSDQRRVGLYADMPTTPPGAGYSFRCTDAPYTFEYNGSLWVPFHKDWQVTLPLSSGWSWDNQGSGTVDFSHGAMYLYGPRTGGSNLRLQYRTAPTTPYKVTIAYCLDASDDVSGSGASGDNSGFGPGFRDATGKISVYYSGYSGGWFENLDNYTNSTTYSSNSSNWTVNANSFKQNSPRWKRIQDTGTNLIYEWSLDGYNWNTKFSGSRTAFMGSGPNAYGMIMYCNGNSPRVQILSIQES